jgi:thiosulfate reductase cytochrome b subunit
MVDACAFVLSSFAYYVTFTGLAHTVFFAKSAVFEVLSEVFGQLARFVCVFVVNLRILFVDICVALVLVLGGYPSELTGLEVANLIKGAEIGINVLYGC